MRQKWSYSMALEKRTMLSVELSTCFWCLLPVKWLFHVHTLAQGRAKGKEFICHYQHRRKQKSRTEKMERRAQSRATRKWKLKHCQWWKGAGAIGFLQETIRFHPAECTDVNMNSEAEISLLYACAPCPSVSTSRGHTLEFYTAFQEMHRYGYYVPCMVMHALNPSVRGAGAGGSLWHPGQLGLHSETLSQNKKEWLLWHCL